MTKSTIENFQSLTAQQTITGQKIL